MGIEAFLLFISTLISLNTEAPAEVQTVKKVRHTEVRHTVIPENNETAGRCRGGWDGN